MTVQTLGTDLSCISDLDPAMLEVSGRILLAQAAARRLSSPRGCLIDDPNYGYDLTQFLNDDLSPADVGRIQAQATTECLKDERVLSAQVTISVPPGPATALLVTVSLQDNAGPFRLVLAVSALTVQLLQVTT